MSGHPDERPSTHALVLEVASNREKLRKVRDMLSETRGWMEEFALPHLDAQGDTDGGHALSASILNVLQETQD